MPRMTRSLRIAYRLNADEAARLRAAAKATGTPLTTYARRAALDVADIAALAARLVALESRAANLPTRDEIRADLSRVAERLVAASKPTTAGAARTPQ